MKRVSFIVLAVLAVVSLASCRSNKGTVSPAPAEDICAVLGFQYGTNVAAQEAKDIADVFRVHFHPSKYKVTEDNRGNSNKRMTKEQMCEVGRSLGAKYVVVGTINKLMDEYSVDVQVVNVLKETTVAFEGGAFQKADCGKEMENIAKRLASKIE